jgi:hypothetical protein
MMMIPQMMKVSDSSIEDKVNEFMLMAKEDYDNKIKGSDVNDEEVVVDLEGELINCPRRNC